MERREFIQMAGASVAVASTAWAQLGAAEASPGETASEPQAIVNFIWDGLGLTPAEFTAILHREVQEKKIETDYYSNGGIVEEMEKKFASLLGKERAVFMPTGTMANHIALRQLAGDRRRVIVQAESHIYNDSGDCVQTLSSLNLLPLAPGRASFTLEEFEGCVQRARSGRVKTLVGAISIESPVRRQRDAMFGLEEMRRVSRFARSEGIPLHLDGARLFVEAVHSGAGLKEYGELFDTIYVSLYKCFNSGSGAVLAGTAAFCEDLFHVRRMFGGGMPNAWPFAAVAMKYIDGFLDEYRTAWAGAETLFKLLDRYPAFGVNRFKNGTHVVELKVKGVNLESMRERLMERRIDLRPPLADGSGFQLKINPSLNRMPPEKIAEAFIQAASH